MEASRPATIQDLPWLAELVASGEAELRSLRGGEVWASSRYCPEGVEAYLMAALTSPDILVLAGTIDEVVVGYAIVRIERLPDGRVLGQIDDLFVEAEARSVGLGSCLMVDVLAWCKQRGCSGVDAVTLPGHRATKNFFEESGFTARLLVMHCPL
jgi:GNAT superfamily N-acetyltransferase